MFISGFTFLRDVARYGYPFLESIRSALPLVDEFVVALGPCEDDTPALLSRLEDKKIRVFHTHWSPVMREKGFVYGQQKMIGQYLCTGRWILYLEADEVLHEQDLPKIRGAVARFDGDDRVESFAFRYLHFYGNCHTLIHSPGWGRIVNRIIRGSVRSIAPDGLYWTVLQNNRRMRYPRAVDTGVTLYHYGWARREEVMEKKQAHASTFWSKTPQKPSYASVPMQFLRPFSGSHPAVMAQWIKENDRPFTPTPGYRPTLRERKHLIGMQIEGLTGMDFSKKHCRIIGKV